MQQSERCYGTLAWYDWRLGYGFITPKDGEKDIFFHGSDCNSLAALEKNRPVSFQVISSRKGPRAVDVDAAENDMG